MFWIASKEFLGHSEQLMMFESTPMAFRNGRITCGKAKDWIDWSSVRVRYIMGRHVHCVIGVCVDESLAVVVVIDISHKDGSMGGSMPGL